MKEKKIKCNLRRILMAKPEHHDFIDEVMHGRYAKDYVPAYRDFTNTKNKSVYMGLALEIRKNAMDGKYEQE